MDNKIMDNMAKHLMNSGYEAVPAYAISPDHLDSILQEVDESGTTVNPLLKVNLSPIGGSRLPYVFMPPKTVKKRLSWSLKGKYHGKDTTKVFKHIVKNTTYTIDKELYDTTSIERVPDTEHQYFKHLKDFSQYLDEVRGDDGKLHIPYFLDSRGRMYWGVDEISQTSHKEIRGCILSTEYVDNKVAERDLAIAIGSYIVGDKKLDEEKFNAGIAWKNNPEEVIVAEDEAMDNTVSQLCSQMFADRVNCFVSKDATASGAQVNAVLSHDATAIGNCIGIDAPKSVWKEFFKCTGFGEEDYDAVKKGAVAYMYGGQHRIKGLLGDDEEKFNIFKREFSRILPGPDYIRHVLVDTWDDSRATYEWTTPDYQEAKCYSKVLVENHVTVSQVIYINGNTFGTVSAGFTRKEEVIRAKPRMVDGYRNQGTLGLAANCIHSMDAYVMREVTRMCSIDREYLARKYRHLGVGTATPEMEKWVEMWNKNHIVSLEMVGDITVGSKIPLDMLQALTKKVQLVLSKPAVPMITVHDEFSTLPGNMDNVVQYYAYVLGDLYESTILLSIMEELGVNKNHLDTMRALHTSHYDPTMGDKIRSAKYAIC